MELPFYYNLLLNIHPDFVKQTQNTIVNKTIDQTQTQISSRMTCIPLDFKTIQRQRWVEYCLSLSYNSCETSNFVSLWISLFNYAVELIDFEPTSSSLWEEYNYMV